MPPRPSVLLVDDRESNLLVLEAFLEDLDCDLVRSTSGNDALKQLLRRDFAVVLLDVQMPDMDGYEVATHIRGHPTTCDVPIVLVTANFDTRDGSLHGLDVGVDDYLAKPIHPKLLRNKVRTYLELYRRKLELETLEVAHAAAVESLGVAQAVLAGLEQAAPVAIGGAIGRAIEHLETLTADARDDTTRRALGRPLEELRVARGFLDTLTAFASDVSPGTRGNVDLTVLVADIARSLEADPATSRVRIDAGPLPTVNVDAKRFGRIVRELVALSIRLHGAEPSARIVVSVDSSNTPMSVCVASPGLDLDDERCDRAFAALSDGFDLREADRSDLVLVACRTLVQRSGGRLSVDAGPGRGARFYFTLSG